MRKCNHSVRYGDIYRNRIVFIGWGISRHFHMNVIASACNKSACVGCRSVDGCRRTVRAAGGNGKVLGEIGHKCLKKFFSALITKVYPFTPRGISPVTPKASVVNRGQINTASSFQLGTAMRAGARNIMHIMDGVLRGKSVNACVGNQFFCIVAICFDKIGIAVAEALRGILRIIKNTSVPYVYHSPIVNLFSIIFPARRRFS